jgi:hypothetical protein
VSISELHPEYLLDKHARGELTAEERERLDAHVAKCTACRFELEVRADFAEELAGEDERISGLVRLAEEAARQGRKEAAETREEAPAPLPVAVPRRRRSLAVWLVAAAALLVVGGAAASETGRRIWLPIFVREPVTAPAPPAAELHEKATSTTAAPKVTRPSVDETPKVDETPASTATPPAATAPQAATAAVHAPPSAGALLDAETDARRRGDQARVLELHTELVTKHPRSHEAQVSRATVARMLLDRGDATSALVGFDAYLANGGGELGEDAMAGRAVALERLGRPKEARDAWAALLATYPGSVYAGHAEAQVDAADGR